MTNVVQLFGRARPSPVVKVAKPTALPAAVPTQEEGATVGRIEITAASQMVQALQFYAGSDVLPGGWDEGRRARQALQGLATVMLAQQSEIDGSQEADSSPSNK